MSDYQVGQDVYIVGRDRRTKTTVTKVGRLLVHVDDGGHRTAAFEISTGRERSPWPRTLYTPAELAELDERRLVLDRLRGADFFAPFGSSKFTTDQLRRVADILEESP